MNRMLSLALCAAVLALAPMASQAADDAKPLTVNKSTRTGTVAGGAVEQVTATVSAIDLTTRMVTLKTKEGEETIRVGEDAKNLAQVKVGDRVVVTVNVGVVLSLQAPGSTAVAPAAVVSAGAAAPGEKPAGDVRARITGTVTIAAIDMKTRVVTLVGPEGRKFKVTAGKGVAIDKVKVGDKVFAEYEERFAIAVKPAKAAKK
jgi:hypothetical protein